MSLAAQIINENKRTQSPFLDLGRCDLEYTWPEEILDFDWLEEISFAPVYYDSYENDNKFTPNKGGMNKFKGNEGFERLQRLPRLRQLDFSLTEISKVDFLRSLPRLRILELASNPISDISPVTSLKHLMYLNVVGAQFKDMSPLSHLTELRHLYLSGSPHTGFLPITNLSFLRPLKKLITLDITHSDLTDISALSELTELTYLKLFVCKITSVNGIQGLYNLKNADLSSNNIKDLLPLYSRDVSLSSLEQLNLNDNKIEQLDLQVLSNLHHLDKISIYNNKVKNVPHDILHYGTIGEVRAYLRRNG